MKVTLELPQELLKEIDYLVQEDPKRSQDRSNIIRQAVKEYLTRHKPSQTEGLETSQRIQEAIRARILQEHPELKKSRTTECSKQEFERITMKIRKKMPWKRLQELEQAMRGNDLGLVRY